MRVHFRLLCLGVAWASLIAHAQEQREVWRFDMKGRISSTAALSPDRRMLFVGVENRLGVGDVVAIDLADPNREKWKYRFTKPVRSSSPAIAADGRSLYIGCDDGRVYQLNTATGAVMRDLLVGAAVETSPALGADGTVYFGADNGKLYAATADLVKRWEFAANDVIDSSPVIGPDGTIYFGSWDKHIYAVNPNGSLKWRHLTGDLVTGSAAIGPDGTIYIGSHDLRLYALAPDGTRKWEFPSNGAIWSTPVVGADGTVYFSSHDTNFYALDPNATDENRVKWKSPLNATTLSSAAVRGDGVVIVAVDGGRVIAFEPLDGAKRWEFRSNTDDALADASPLVAPDGSIYVGLLDGYLYKLAGNGSPLSQFSSWPAFRRDPQNTGRAAAGGEGQLLNISARAQVAGDATLIAGLAIRGAAAKAYLIRGVGPALAQFGVPGPMPDPRLQLFSGGMALPYRNDNWGETLPLASNFGVADTPEALGAFPLPVDSKDAALVAPLAPGLYTAHVESVDGRGGVVLLEAYDARAGDPTARIVNLSTRGQVGTNGNVLIPGVVVGGAGQVRLLIRGVGPGLAPFGVTGWLARPTLAVFSGSRRVAENTGWTTTGLRWDLRVAAELVGAFSLADSSADSALILEAAPGNYTIQLSGVGETTGEALVEIYVLPARSGS